MEKKEQVKEFFARYAADYQASVSHKSGKDLEEFVRAVRPRGHEKLLDVATATGHTAYAFAPHVAEVVGLDLTPAMEAQFLAQGRERNLTNARFVVGDAEHIPFGDASFDIVTCRRAAHHFPDVPQAVAEMARVLRPGGKLGIVDMVAPEDPAAAQLMNQMEIARDGSHARALSAAEWRVTAAAAGLNVQQADVLGEDIPFAQWLNPVACDGPEAAEAERLASAALPAVAAQVVQAQPDGSLLFLKRRIILVAVK